MDPLMIMVIVILILTIINTLLLLTRGFVRRP
jgi:hypothetical protein